MATIIQTYKCSLTRAGRVSSHGKAPAHAAIRGTEQLPPPPVILAGADSRIVAARSAVGFSGVFSGVSPNSFPTHFCDHKQSVNMGGPR